MDALYESHVDVRVADVKVNIIPQVVNVKVVDVKVVSVPPDVHGIILCLQLTIEIKFSSQHEFFSWVRD